MESDRLTKWGSLASIVGVVVAIAGLAFSEYKLVSMISLLVFETAVLAVWWFYARKRTLMLYPHEWEELYSHARYVIRDPDRMLFERYMVIRVTSPTLSRIPIKLAWTGKGTLTVTSVLHQGPLPFAHDASSGVASFDLPLPMLRFGDTAIVHYAADCQDQAHVNQPLLAKLIERPTGVSIMEAVLEYKEEAPPAKYCYRAGAVPLSGYTTPLEEVEFDKATRSYRVVTLSPVLDRIYELSWEK